MTSVETIVARSLMRYTPEPNSGCWLWDGAVTSQGYANVARNSGEPRNFLVHRLMYEHFKGPIPTGLDLDHKCRVRCCINPDHLEAVTRSENLARGHLEWNSGNKAKTSCFRGHPLSGANLRSYSNGHRSCRQCDRDRDREYKRQARTKTPEAVAPVHEEKTNGQ